MSHKMWLISFMDLLMPSAIGLSAWSHAYATHVLTIAIRLWCVKFCLSHMNVRKSSTVIYSGTEHRRLRHIRRSPLVLIRTALFYLVRIVLNCYIDSLNRPLPCVLWVTPRKYLQLPVTSLQGFWNQYLSVNSTNNNNNFGTLTIIIIRKLVFNSKTIIES